MRLKAHRVERKVIQKSSLRSVSTIGSAGVSVYYRMDTIFKAITLMNNWIFFFSQIENSRYLLNTSRISAQTYTHSYKYTSDTGKWIINPYSTIWLTQMAKKANIGYIIYAYAYTKAYWNIHIYIHTLSDIQRHKNQRNIEYSLSKVSCLANWQILL